MGMANTLPAQKGEASHAGSDRRAAPAAQLLMFLPALRAQQTKKQDAQCSMPGRQPAKGWDQACMLPQTDSSAFWASSILTPLFGHRET